MGGLLVLMLARFAPDEQPAVGANLPTMPFADWRRLVIDLLEALGFEIALEHQDERELDIVARSTAPLREGRFLVHAILAAPGDVVNASRVRQLEEAVQGDESTKGILIAPCRIEGEGLATTFANIELVDGRKLRELVARYLPEKLPLVESGNDL